MPRRRIEARARPDRRVGQQRDGDGLRAGLGHRAGGVPARDRGHLPRLGLGDDGRARRMRPRDRGVIVQVGSALAYRGIPLQAAYCGAKHALQGFLESLRTELLHDGSNVRRDDGAAAGAEHAAVHLEPREAAAPARSPCRRSSSPRSRPRRSSWRPQPSAARGDGRLADGQGDLRQRGRARRSPTATSPTPATTRSRPTSPLEHDRRGQPVRARRRATGRARPVRRARAKRYSVQLWARTHRRCAAGSRRATGLAAAAVGAVIGGKP